MHDFVKEGGSTSDRGFLFGYFSPKSNYFNKAPMHRYLPFWSTVLSNPSEPALAAAFQHYTDSQYDSSIVFARRPRRGDGGPFVALSTRSVLRDKFM